MQKQDELTPLDLIRQYIKLNIDSVKEDLKKISDSIPSNKKEVKEEIEKIEKRIATLELAMKAATQTIERHDQEIQQLERQQKVIIEMQADIKQIKKITETKDNRKFNMLIMIVSPFVASIVTLLFWYLFYKQSSGP